MDACIYMYIFMDICMHDNIQRMFEQENKTMINALNKKVKETV